MHQPHSQDVWEKIMDELVRWSRLPFFPSTAQISSDEGQKNMVNRAKSMNGQCPNYRKLYSTKQLRPFNR